MRGKSEALNSAFFFRARLAQLCMYCLKLAPPTKGFVITYSSTLSVGAEANAGIGQVELTPQGQDLF